MIGWPERVMLTALPGDVVLVPFPVFSGQTGTGEVVASRADFKVQISKCKMQI